MPIQRIKLRNTETGQVVEVAPAAAGYFAGFEPVEKPAQISAPASEPAAATPARTPRPAADKNKEQ